jgi:rare lipoprotein A
VILLSAFAALLGGCAETELASHGAKILMRDAETPHQSTPLPDGYKLGKPYAVDGVTYYPYHDPAFIEQGLASWYGGEFHGRDTASGEPFDMNAVTAAHRTLPLPSTVKVTNLENGRELLVRVNDRGPFVNGRVIDLSRRSAQLLGVYGKGTAPVRVEFVRLADLMPPAAPEPDSVYVARQGDLDAEPEPVALRRKDSAAAPAERERTITVRPTPKASVLTRRADDEAEAKAPPAASPKQAKEASAAVARPRAKPKPSSGGGGLIASANAAEPDELMAPLPSVASTTLFVQVGAFLGRGNADEVRARLSPLGKVFIQSAKQSDRVIYRVRFGPIASVEEADTLLDRLIHAGYSTAKVVVETN